MTADVGGDLTSQGYPGGFVTPLDVSPRRHLGGGLLVVGLTMGAEGLSEPGRSDPARGDGQAQTGADIVRVWIDQDLCTGDGLCEEICPQVFTLLEDGLAYVKEGERVLHDPGGAEGVAQVPSELEDALREAAEECPGECIFIVEE